MQTETVAYLKEHANTLEWHEELLITKKLQDLNLRDLTPKVVTPKVEGWSPCITLDVYPFLFALTFHSTLRTKRTAW